MKALASGEKTKGWFASSAWLLERRLPDIFALKKPTVETSVSFDIRNIVKEAQVAALEFEKLNVLPCQALEYDGESDQ
jgi:hypothetical protein